ncbi:MULTISPECIES: hypothetical protein [unclassified Lentimonas]|uniref:hypothetical protein n=1 Tax=unclassified Lentimonas TaxID=2630993 RepID=UPI0013230BEE|nr:MULTISPECIES: hypothetical protein [unclassified Lentimonas]CAA6690205.1 Unannotated [Lentimonas sp. CC10]CAA6695969.1 Unannotated [Lentimonas sp. CC19]CAA7070234.1 Unannotated [Lentimonas sp. CC11]
MTAVILQAAEGIIVIKHKADFYGGYESGEIKGRQCEKELHRFATDVFFGRDGFHHLTIEIAQIYVVEFNAEALMAVGGRFY